MLSRAPGGVKPRGPWDNRASMTREGALRTTLAASSAALALFALAGPALAEPAMEVPPPPADLAERIAAAGTSEDHDGADAVVVLDSSTVRVEGSGQSHTVRRRVVKALTEEGAAALSHVRLDYDPATMEVEVLAVRVHRPGAGPTDVDLSTIVDAPQPGHWIYWGLRNLLLAVPRPRVGDAVETVVYRTGFQIAYLDEPQDRERFVPPMRGHFYDIVLFGESPWPTVEQRYEVTLPRDKPLQFEVLNGPVHVASTFDEESFHHEFWRRDLPAFEPEASAPAPSDGLPKVVMATVPDWQAKSRWFFHVNERQFEPDDAIRAQVAAITRGLRTDEERVTALVRWVAHFIRYRGLSMGEGEGYTLHPGTMVFAERAGVCKDIASMLVTMMRAAGFTVFPAMTMAGARVERIPADQFNHSVVAWQQPDGSFRMLDPTWAPMSRDLWSHAEREQHYLVGTPEGEDLAITTPEGPEHNVYDIRGEGRLAEDGTVTSTVAIATKGYMDDRLRRLFGFGPALETRRTVEKMVQAIAPTARLEAFGLEDHLDLDRDFAVRFRYRAEGYGQRAGRLIRLPALPLGHNVLVHPRLVQHLEATVPGSRTSPLLLRCAVTMRVEERLDLPRGYDLVAPYAREVRTGGGAFSASIRQEGRRVVLAMTVTVDRRRFEASEYGQVRDLAEAQRALSSTPIALARAPEVAR